MPRNPGSAMADAPFDDMAEAYDEVFTNSPMGRVLRDLIWKRLARSYGPAQRILELNCGTGEDAIWLCQGGLKVLATDASAAMLAAARRKSELRGCTDRIEFRQLAIEQLGDLPATEKFDGLLSNFGGVNCVPDIGFVARESARRLNPGAVLVWVVMGRYVPWEWFWYLCRMDPGKAFRRLGKGGSRWRGITLNYPSPATVCASLEPFFRIRDVAPLGLLLPPSYAAGWLNRLPALLRLLGRVEGLVHSVSSLAWISDHYIVEAERI